LQATRSFQGMRHAFQLKRDLAVTPRTVDAVVPLDHDVIGRVTALAAEGLNEYGSGVHLAAAFGLLEGRHRHGRSVRLASEP
jgi:hypothetical protein